MLGMGGAARPHYIVRFGVLQAVCIWLYFQNNSAGGDPEARPMGAPEGSAPIPRWGTALPLSKRRTSRPPHDDKSRPASRSSRLIPS